MQALADAASQASTAMGQTATVTITQSNSISVPTGVDAQALAAASEALLCQGYPPGTCSVSVAPGPVHSRMLTHAGSIVVEQALMVGGVAYEAKRAER